VDVEEEEQEQTYRTRIVLASNTRKLRSRDGTLVFSGESLLDLFYSAALPKPLDRTRAGFFPTCPFVTLLRCDGRAVVVCRTCMSL
jgi:hypothetical protein